MRKVSRKVEETVALGERLGQLLRPGDVVALVGPLGTGKTYFTKGLVKGLGSDMRVTSPSFVLVNEYRGRTPIYHIDAYRLEHADKLSELGSEELFYGDGVCIVEWADKVRSILPPERLEIEFAFLGKDARLIRFNPSGTRAEELVRELEGSAS